MFHSLAKLATNLRNRCRPQHDAQTRAARSPLIESLESRTLLSAASVTATADLVRSWKPTATPALVKRADVSTPTVTVRTVGGSMGHDPTGQCISWTGSSALTYDITRINPNGSTTTLAANYHGNSFVDKGSIAATSNPAVYYYRVTAVDNGVTSAASAAVCAPQVYYFEGYGDTSGNYAQMAYDASMGCELHYFYLFSLWHGENNYNFSAIHPAAGPVAVIGFSGGGDAAAHFCTYVATTLGRAADLKYLALLAPVRLWGANLANPSFSPQYVSAADDWYTPLSWQARSYHPWGLPEAPIFSSNPNYATFARHYAYHGQVVLDSSVVATIRNHLNSITWDA